ncbi:MAG: hypothetical protein JWN89_44 [Parcubacteria group bacterium]|nr:hypothetical protein [Parcubacteria group bacterium]
MSTDSRDQVFTTMWIAIILGSGTVAAGIVLSNSLVLVTAGMVILLTLIFGSMQYGRSPLPSTYSRWWIGVSLGTIALAFLM